MSVETFRDQYPAGDRFAEAVIKRAEFRRGYSRMRALADSMYNEGRAGLREVHRDLRNSRRFVPASPLSSEIPATYKDSISLNAGAVLWGSIFRTTEIIATARFYDPSFFAHLVRDGFRGMGWADSINLGNPEEKEPTHFTHAKVAALTHEATVDPRMTFIFTRHGFNLLPPAFQGDILGTALFNGMISHFGPIYHARSDALLRAPLTPLEQKAKELQLVLPQNRPLTFR